MAGWTTFRFTAVLVFVCTSTGLQNKSQESAKPKYDDSEGYAVLSVLLDNHLSSKRAAITISPETVPESGMWSSLNCGKKPNGFEAAEKDFHEKNKLAFGLASKFSIKSEYEFYDEKKFALPPPKPGEQELHLETYGPLYFVSAVGFDPARTRAIAYSGANCGGECGGGGYYFFAKDAKGWKEVPGSPACEWVSRNQVGSRDKGTL